MVPFFHSRIHQSGKQRVTAEFDGELLFLFHAPQHENDQWDQAPKQMKVNGLSKSHILRNPPQKGIGKTYFQ